MGYRETKENFDKDMEKFATLKPKDREVTIQAWTLRLMFEVYGELSSLAHCYREMLKIQQEREKKNGQTAGHQSS